jgi:hypothetical protein
MPGNYPKFDKKIQDQIDNVSMQKSRTRPGIIVSYNRASSTADVILDEQYSENMGNVLKNVPCPLVKGVQSVSPTLGTRCLIGFRDTNESNPYILNFFDDVATNKFYIRNSVVNTGIPRFMVH